jgi:hypothetical protein
MEAKVDCATHGEQSKAFVCTHLAEDGVELGFNRNGPTDEEPFPDAWCDNCEVIRAAHGGWNQQSEELVKIVLLCSECYERACIRNTRPSVTLADLARLRWKCSRCEEWHTGPCLDISYDSPYYWTKQDEHHSRKCEIVSNAGISYPKLFLNDNYCAINDSDFFVRGVIHLPIIGTAETFRWGVWGSVSRDNFGLLLRDEEEKGNEPPAMFSWLSNQIPEYPDTLNLKMYAQVQKAGWRPIFELEKTDHPLSQEYQHGISPERVKEIMTRRLRDIELLQ